MTQRQVRGFAPHVRSRRIPEVKKHYTEKTTQEQHDLWYGLFGLDEAYMLYGFATGNVVIEANLNHPNIGNMMRTTFAVACHCSWDLVISRRRYNRKIDNHPLRWLKPKAYLKARPQQAFAKVRTVDSDCLDSEADNYPGGIQEIIVAHSGQTRRKKRTLEQQPSHLKRSSAIAGRRQVK